MRTFCSVLLFLLVINAHANQSWQVVAQESELRFVANYDEIPFDGIFEHFAVDLIFDENDLYNNKLKTSIDVTSINTNSRDRDEALANSDWFHFSKFPQAIFVSNLFSKLNDSSFQVTGTLTIRDISRELSFPFTWQNVNSHQARVTARFNLDRRDFDIGNGEWLQDETIGFSVLVKLSLLLEKQL